MSTRKQPAWGNQQQKQRQSDRPQQPRDTEKDTGQKDLPRDNQKSEQWRSQRGRSGQTPMNRERAKSAPKPTISHEKLAHLRVELSRQEDKEFYEALDQNTGSFKLKEHKSDDLIKAMNDIKEVTGRLPYTSYLKYAPEAFCYYLKTEGLNMTMYSDICPTISFCIEQGRPARPIWRALALQLKASQDGGKASFPKKSELFLTRVGDAETLILAANLGYIDPRFVRAITAVQRRYRANKAVIAKKPIPKLTPLPRPPYCAMKMTEAKEANTVLEFRRESFVLLRWNMRLCPTILATLCREPRHAHGVIPFFDEYMNMCPEIDELLDQRDTKLREQAEALLTSWDAFGKMKWLKTFYLERRLDKIRDVERDKLKFYTNVFKTNQGTVATLPGPDYMFNSICRDLPPPVLIRLTKELPLHLASAGQKLLYSFRGIKLDELPALAVVGWFSQICVDEHKVFSSNDDLFVVDLLFRTPPETITDERHLAVVEKMRMWLQPVQKTIRDNAKLLTDTIYFAEALVAISTTN